MQHDGMAREPNDKLMVWYPEISFPKPHTCQKLSNTTERFPPNPALVSRGLAIFSFRIKLDLLHLHTEPSTPTRRFLSVHLFHHSPTLTDQSYFITLTIQIDSCPYINIQISLCYSITYIIVDFCQCYFVNNNQPFTWFEDVL